MAQATRTPAEQSPPQVPPVGVAGAVGSIDELFGLRRRELDALYRDATVPSARELDGPFRGAALAASGWAARPGVREALALIARQRWMPWRGKSFVRGSESRGGGSNRMLSDRLPLHLFRFETFRGPSAFDGGEALVFNYALGWNPPGVRSVRDEVRRLSDDLYLGQAWLRLGRDRFLLYFALQRP